MPKVIRAVLVGCGGISKTWLNAIKRVPDVELVGLVDLDERLARERADEFGLQVPVSSSLAAMLRDTSPDAVFDCTIPEAHHEVTLAALESGCHVLGEKPISDDLAKAKAMLAAAEKAGKLYAVIQNRRYHKSLRSLRRLLESGAIGTVTTIHSDFFIGAHFGGFRDRMRHVLLKDMAIHTFDAGRFLAGQDPQAVYCHEWNPAGSWYDHGASAIAIFEMSEGVVFSYRGSWAAEGFRTSWEGQWRIIGDQGSAYWDGADILKAQVVADATGFLAEYRDLEIPTDDFETMLEGHAGVIHDFVHALRTGTAPETGGTDNIKSLMMVFAAVESAVSGKRVELPLRRSLL